MSEIEVDLETQKVNFISYRFNFHVEMAKNGYLLRYSMRRPYHDEGKEIDPLQYVCKDKIELNEKIQAAMLECRDFIFLKTFTDPFKK